MSSKLRFALLIAGAVLPAAGQISAQLSGSDTPIDPAQRPIWERPAWGHMEGESPAPQVRVAPREENGSISITELKNPLKGKSLRVIQRAMRDLKDGKTNRAMEDLRKALADPNAQPHALCLMGTEHLKMGLVDVAIAELEGAVTLLPGNAAAHNNLGYALWLKRQNGRATEEVEKALQLDPSSPHIRFLMGGLLLEQGREQEALHHLHLAAEQLGSARRVLAEYYTVRGNAAMAEQLGRGGLPAGVAAFRAK